MGNKPALMKGWNFTREDYEEAGGKLLTAQIETSNICNLACEYCFRAEGDEAKKKLDGELTLAETLTVVDQVTALGAKTVNIIGAGEPLMDRHFFTIVDYVAERGAVPVVFTNGFLLDKIEVRQGLYDIGASVVIKVNSFDESLQNCMVGRKNYAANRNVALQKLLESDFNQPGEDYDTRLGIDCVVYQRNKHEILDIFRFCRRNNIMSLFKTFIPIGRAAERSDLEIGLDEFLVLSGEAERIDREEFGIEYGGGFPFMWGTSCTQKGPWAVYVNVQGEIYDCPGQKQHYGNVRAVSLVDAFQELKKESHNFYLTCPVRLK